MTGRPTGSRAQAARLFHALSDETRLRILERLAAGERCVCELTGALAAEQSRLSFHLRTLKDAGLIRARRQGRWVYYALEPGGLSRAAAIAAGLADRARPAGTVRAASARRSA